MRWEIASGRPWTQRGCTRTGAERAHALAAQHEGSRAQARPVCYGYIIAIEVVEDIIVLVPVLPNNDAIIAPVLSIVAFDVSIDVFIVRVLTIVTYG
jgi:hypothetical protein